MRSRGPSDYAALGRAMAQAASRSGYRGPQAGRSRPRAMSIQVRARALGWSSAHAMWRAAARRRGFHEGFAEMGPAELGTNNQPRRQIVAFAPAGEIMDAFDALPADFRALVARSASDMSLETCAIAASATDRPAAIARMAALDAEQTGLGTLALYGPDHPQAPETAHLGKMMALGFVEAADSMIAACHQLGLTLWDTIEICRDEVARHA